jgi:hypothetical protein
MPLPIAKSLYFQKKKKLSNLYFENPNTFYFEKTTKSLPKVNGSRRWKINFTLKTQTTK